MRPLDFPLLADENIRGEVVEYERTQPEKLSTRAVVSEVDLEPRLDAVADGVPDGIVITPRSARRLRHVLKINTGFGGANGALVLSHG